MWAKQSDIWVGTLFCNEEIDFSDTVGVMKVRVKLNGQVSEILFELNVTETTETYSLFTAGLSI